MLLFTEFNILLMTVRLMSVENAESVSSALQQDSKSLNELLRTTDISVCCICIIELSLIQIEE